MTNLGRALAAYQQKFDTDGKALAKAIGIEESTLSRIKAGRMPDALGMARVIMWLASP
jgi:DNA-binding XRE family transcriptional regulator